MEQVIPKVFISYTYDSPEHIHWVENLAPKLRNPGGVDAIFDKWEARLGNDLPFFMEQGLTNAHLVLCICSSKYVEKANAGIGGAGYEKRIIAAQLMENANKEYVIPVMVNNAERKLPTFLMGSKYIEFKEDDFYSAYRDLLYRIHGMDKDLRPELAPNPFGDGTMVDNIKSMVRMENVNFVSSSMEGHVTFAYKRNSGLFTIGTGEYEFKTQWSECGQRSIYAYRDHVHMIGFHPTKKQLPTINEINEFDYTSRAWPIPKGGVFVLINKNKKIAAIKVLEIHTEGYENEHTVEFEYKIIDGI